MFVDPDRCMEFGLDPQKVASVVRRLSKAATEARAMGLVIFGGAGAGSLRYTKGDAHGAESAVAYLDGQFDGGDAGELAAVVHKALRG